MAEPVEKPSVNLWAMPALDAAGLTNQADDAAGDASLEEAYEKAYQEGLELGRKEGLAQARSDTEGLHLQLQSLIEAVETGYGIESDHLAEELATLAGAVSEQIVRSEITLRPELITRMIEQAVAELPGQYERATALLHPEDAATMKEYINGQGAQFERWSIVADTSVKRGDCVLQVDNSVIQARVHELCQQVVLTALEGSDH